MARNTLVMLMLGTLLGCRTTGPGGPDGPGVAAPSGGDSCALTTKGAIAGPVLPEADFERLVAFAAGYLRQHRALPSGRQALEATGLEEVPVNEVSRIKAAVAVRVKDDPALADLASPSRCDDYAACSVTRSLDGELSVAGGETLTMYVREKGEDGRVFTDFELPDFPAEKLGGGAASSGALRGRAGVLAMLAGHCAHSIQSLPVLERAHQSYGDRLLLTAVFVNSGGRDKLAEWVPSYNPSYAVWASPGEKLGDALRTHLVPSYFFVDADGRVRGKLVGFKSQAELAAWIDDWVKQTGQRAAR